MIIIDNAFANVTYQEDGRYILFAYKKFGTSKVFRETWNKTGEVVVEKQVNKYLSDSRKMAVLSLEDQQWFAEEWSPSIQRQVQKDTFTAIVLDSGAFTEMSAKSISNKVGGDTGNGVIVTFEFFKDVEAAKEWIKHVETQLKPLAR